MGFGSSKEQTVTQLLELSQTAPIQYRLREADVQEIMMNSQFTEAELLKLYIKF